jgi:subtilisin family serine protease
MTTHGLATRAAPARRLALPLAVLAAALAAAPAAADGGIAVGARAGTTGFGAEVAFPLGSRAGVRLAAGAGAFDVEFESREIRYDGEVDLASVLAVADLHPFRGGFRLSLGALVHDNTLEGTAPVRELLLEEGIAVPPGLELGRLRARASVEPVAPYLGLGWGSAPGGSGLSLSLDLGAAWHGEPDVDLAYEGPLPLDIVVGQPVVDRLREEEERELEAELADYSVFPVVAVALVYRF